MIPDFHISTFKTVFKSLQSKKLKVLWKFDKTPKKFPKNVFTMERVPQNLVLGHKNVKIFITNGGVCSIQEGIYHGVPMIVVPFMLDQVKF